ncbi:MAG: sigma-70 family RNA polymerase sigma factor [Planctomycetota bacterium]
MEAPITSNKSEPEPGSDETLVSRARSGDTAAFDALILRHQDRVYNMAYRMLGNREDALDLSQEVFITVFRGLGRFEAKARFSTWLYRVTVNRCRDALRRRGSVKHTRPQSLDAARDGESPREIASTGRPPPEEAMGREVRERVEGAIGELPEDTREVLILRDREDLSYEEIAEILAIPVGTVRSRLNRARTLLRELLRPILEVES